MGDVEKDAGRHRVSADDMTSYLVEDRRAAVSPWGLGNSKLGPHVYTYSLPAGRSESCPGATQYCEALCYAKHIESGNSWVAKLYRANAERGDDLPALPADARLVRGHVSGDFHSVGYVRSWVEVACGHPDVLFWFYTRSWRVQVLRFALEELRALPNVQVWASLDPDCRSPLPPDGWRRAWMSGDDRLQRSERGNSYLFGGRLVPTCPEETGERSSCEACGYCFRPGRHGDLVFLEHGPSAHEPKNCARCGGPEAAHSDDGPCVCAMPDARPCGCTG